MKYGQVFITILIAVALLTPSISITVDALSGGGEVTNTAPSVSAMSVKTKTTDAGTETYYQTSGGTPTSELNDDGNDWIVVNATVLDVNGESDIIYVNFSVNAVIADWENVGATYYLNHTVSATDRSNSSEPAFTDNEVHGWDNATSDNGYLTFSFKHIFDFGDDPTNGAWASATYTFTVTVVDSAGASDTDTDTCDVYNYANVTTSQSYWADDNTVNASDTMWGNWSGSAGTTMASKNYMKEWNNESTGTGNVSIAWGGVNLENSTNTIALTNVDIVEGEAVNASAVASWVAATYNATRMNNWVAITHSTASQTVSWVNYTINVPASTAKGNYSKTFTFTKV